MNFNIINILLYKSLNDIIILYIFHFIENTTLIQLVCIYIIIIDLDYILIDSTYI